ncbi:MAG: histidine kinase N-terminal 7TM domain-containing protein [Clostridia bacterium]|nr:histidine kinase N-terminal 7TM domain-containing protein [Clostridia bacterium]
MNEPARILRRLLVYLLILLVAGNLYITTFSNTFPIRSNSTTFLVACSFCLLLYYNRRVATEGRIKRLMLGIACQSISLMVVRGIKYTLLNGLDVLTRHAWYLYYVPILLIPAFLFCIALLVNGAETPLFRRRQRLVIAITLMLILLIVTNDWHQQVFRFQPGFMNWDDDYDYVWGYVLLTAWEYGLYLASAIVLIKKCRVARAKRHSWLIVLPFALGITLLLMQATDTMPRINGYELIGFPETVMLMVSGAMEVLMGLGLIPTNEGYGKLFRLSGLAAQITDRSGRVVYKSDAASELTPDQLAAPDGTRIGEHTILRRMALPGGFGYWQADVSALDRLNE